jgi:hypothetical protein
VPGLRTKEKLVYNARGKAVGSVREETLVKILRLEEVTVFPEFRELTPEELKEAYRIGREALRRWKKLNGNSTKKPNDHPGAQLGRKPP